MYYVLMYTYKYIHLYIYIYIHIYQVLTCTFACPKYGMTREFLSVYGEFFIITIGHKHINNCAQRISISVFPCST